MQQGPILKIALMIFATLTIIFIFGFASNIGSSLPEPANSPYADINTSLPDYEPLKKQLESYLATRKATYGIYFKDLNTGATWGINDLTPIPAASTIKVPYVLYLNEQVAAGRLKMEQRIAYDSNTDYAGGSGYLKETAADGDRFTLRVLSNLAITLSDNVAYKMIKRVTGEENVLAYMKAMGGTTIGGNGQDNTTARDMAAYMEGVINFSRRNPALGNRLIDDLANPIWHYGLPGKLPDNVKVAHKEGDLPGVSNDVGIVFASRPYIISILSMNQDNIEQGFLDISEISGMIYEYQEKMQL
ncbi:MAG: serine hydrolase [Peptococcaceae bacterium]|nr:MAG: serine hydrolase [Peptococcaceae bacterium]